MKHSFFILLFLLGCSSQLSKNKNVSEINKKQLRKKIPYNKDTTVYINDNIDKKKVYKKFKVIMNKTPEGYNIIEKKYLKQLTGLNINFDNDSIVFKASYIDTSMIDKYDFAKIWKKMNGRYSNIFILFTKNGIESDYLEILNYCKDCKDWSYYSLSGPYYNTKLDSIIGVEAHIYDTINQGKPIHHGFLKIKDTNRWKIINGKFVKSER